MRICFLLPKDPYGYSGGDTAVFRIVLEEAAALAEVSALALTNEAPSPGPVRIRPVPKPRMHPGRLALQSLRSGRSLVHTRFAPSALVSAIRETHVDCFVAEHTYMAEAANKTHLATPLYINCHGFEAEVFASRTDLPGPIRQIEARRIWRDELRCLGGAAGVRCLGDEEVAKLKAHGIDAAHLDIVLEPKPRAPVAREPVALFLGDRLWPPNLEALGEAERLWPEIRRRAPGARLLVVGQGPYLSERAPDGVTRLGFVDDLEQVWSSTRVLLAPVRTGGGVRVKILDAASRGVPLVTTTAGLGSISRYLPIQAVADDTALIERTAHLLSSDQAAESEGQKLWEANHDLWKDGMVRRQLAEWLGL
jgi:glycosyltransferase involved in cell wall biosynthesis